METGAESESESESPTNGGNRGSSGVVGKNAAYKLTLQIEVIGKDRCLRWHQDQYVGRMIITYAGPSTWMVDDKDVNYEMFETLVGLPSSLSDPLIVNNYDGIHQPPSGSIMLIKGTTWPGVEASHNGQGVVHKSPNCATDSSGNPLHKRLLLKVDISEALTEEWKAIEKDEAAKCVIV